MSALVTPGMLATARALGNRGLTSLAEIRRATDDQTDFGSKEAFSTVATDVPCWVRSTAVQSNLTEVANRIAEVGTFRIHFEAETDVRLNDQLVVDGATFSVIDVNAENTIKVFTTVMAKKVE
jgi:hypothetical protein